MNASDRHRDGYGSWALSVAALREIRVRSGEYAPIDDSERRQASEGPCRVQFLDVVVAQSPSKEGPSQ